MTKNKGKRTGFTASRRGQIEYLLQNAFRIGFTIIALLAFFLLISFYINNKIDTRYVQAETLANRIIQSDALMLSDPSTSRVYTGIVDMEKFDDKTSLDDSIQYEFSRHAAAKVKIFRKDVYGKTSYVGEIFLNKDNYDNLKTVMKVDSTGKGGASMIIKNFPVTCAYDKSISNFEYCIMIVEVIVPNS